MTGRLPALGLLLLVAPEALGADVEHEHAQVQERLAAERELFAAVRAQKGDVLTLLELLEQLARGAAARSRALEAEARLLNERLRLAQRQQEVASAALAEQARRLSPRLRLLYRMERQDRLGVLLSAKDFSSWMRRSRAMTALVEQDLEALRAVQSAASFQRRSLRQAEVLGGAAQLRLGALKQERELAEQRRAEFRDLLSALQAEASQSRRVIQELEHAERQLASMVQELKSTVPSSGFRALKGHLPFPTQGLIEVGFGRVVNPKFNTVTVQKGVDLRARAGTPVIAIAPGTVVYAGWLKGYGKLLILDHGGGYHTLMAHLAELEVEVGNEVEAGVVLGSVGDTASLKGAYLYFEIRHDGEAIDPAPWLDENAEPP